MAIDNAPNLLLVDDHKLVATGLAMLLATHFNVTIACNLVEMQACLAKQKVDLALLDLQMSDGHPCKSYREALKKGGVLILIVAATMTDAELFDCYGKGVCGYAPKDSSEKELVHIIRKVLGGGDHWSPDLRHRLKIFSENKPVVQKRFLPVIRHLLAPKPLDDCEIADIEGLSTRTISNYVHMLLNLYEVHDRHELINKLTQMGYTSTYLPD